ncbi:MAG: hypothetical protein RhofKO_38690 [Rhodothermales bacterium]
MEDGIAVFEAERVALSAGWALQDEVEGYSGEGYLTWMEPTTTEANSQGLLAYPFTVSQRGLYTVKIRNYHACEDFTECNDIFVRMNDGEWRKNFNHTLSMWDWNSQQDIDHVFSDAQYELAAGTHTLYLSGRSQDFSIDQIAIFHKRTAAEAYQSVHPMACTTQ